MASISRTLQRIKDDLHPFLPDEMIFEACSRAGHAWRQRLLDPVVTLHLFILQILNFNTAMTHLRHLAKYPVKAAAYCKARMRLPLATPQDLQRSSSVGMSEACDGRGLWCGLRADLVDGTSTITPDTPELDKTFKHPKGQKEGCGFPVPKLLALFDAFSGLVIERLGFPLSTHDPSKVWLLHPLLGRCGLLVGDRGFCSYEHLAMLHMRGLQGVFRMHQRQIVSFRRDRRMKRGKKQSGRPTSRFLRRLGKHDHVVQWYKAKQKPRWLSVMEYRVLPVTLSVREVRYWQPRRGQRPLCVTIVTTLLDPVHDHKEKIADLYNVRSRAATQFGPLQTTLKLRKVTTRTVEGVRKELAISCLLYKLVHAVMVEAAWRQGTTPDRISFIDAVRWLLSADPGESLGVLMENRLRPGRHEPRVVKERHGSYPVMTHPRQTLRKALKNQAISA